MSGRLKDVGQLRVDKGERSRLEYEGKRDEGARERRVTSGRDNKRKEQTRIQGEEGRMDEATRKR